MRTTLNLPNSLIKQAQKILGTRTKTETIVAGLHQVVRSQKIQSLLSMQGKLDLNVDVRKSRKRT